MIFTGGCKYTIASHCNHTYILDLKTGIIERKADMLLYRQSHGICFLNGKVYCAGGLDREYDTNIKMLKSLEIYDLEADEWKEGPSMKFEKMAITLINVDQRYIY